MAETRKDRRAPLSLKVRFKSATLDEFIGHYSQDISSGGLFIKSKKPMKEGTLLKFELQLKDASRVIHGVGRVVWARSAEEVQPGTPAGMGVKFMKMDAESRAFVQKIVQQRDAAPGRFEEGAGEGAAPRASAPAFFPDEGPAKLPPPEDRTAVRHASEFLAEALAGSGAAQEAQVQAEQARKRTEELERERAEAARKAEEAAAAAAASAGPVTAPPPAMDLAAQMDFDDEEDEATRYAPNETKEISSQIKLPEFQDDELEGEPTQLGSAALLGAAIEEALSAEQPLPDDDEDDDDEPASAPTSSSGGPDTVPQAVVPKPEAPKPPAVEEKSEPEAKSGGSKGLIVGLVAVILLAVAVFAGMQFLGQSQGPETPPTPAPAEPVDEPVEPTEGETAEGETLEGEEMDFGMEEAEGSEGEGDGAQVSFEVSSTPEATLFVDGEEVGTTPTEISGTVGAELTLRFVAEGHAALEQTITVEEEDAPDAFELTPLPYVLEITSVPAGATVRAFGQTTRTPGELRFDTLSGPVALTVRLDGFETTRQTVFRTEFVAGEDAHRASTRVQLERAAPTPRMTAMMAETMAAETMAAETMAAETMATETMEAETMATETMEAETMATAPVEMEAAPMEAAPVEMEAAAPTPAPAPAAAADPEAE